MLTFCRFGLTACVDSICESAIQHKTTATCEITLSYIFPPAPPPALQLDQTPRKENTCCLVVRAEKLASGDFRSISAPTMDLLLELVVSSGLWRPWAYWWLEERVKSQALRTSHRIALRSMALLSMQGPAFGGVSQAWKRGRLWTPRKEHALNPFRRGNWIQYLAALAPADGSFWTGTSYGSTLSDGVTWH